MRFIRRDDHPTTPGTKHEGWKKFRDSRFAAKYSQSHPIVTSNKPLAYPSDGLRRNDWRYLADGRGSGGKPPAAHHLLEQFGNHGAALDGQGNRRHR
ncbi:MAG: hypothetical protein ACXW50_22990 [Candidatus Binatia bacterium]